MIEAFSRVMGDIQAIEKDGYNSQQGFNFRGIDAVMNCVGPVLREHGVVIIPRPLAIATERYVTKANTAMRNATVTMEYTVYGPAGDSFVGGAYGEAADSGDKAVSKAQSVAYRTFLLQGLTIPTRQADPDANSHERVAANPEAKAARDELAELCNTLGISLGQAVNDFAAANGGLDIRDATDPGPIRALAERYRTANNPPPAEDTEHADEQEPAGE
ncbi:ERF family protein [Nocardia cyriacigeorgica]|uniref:ERF family protein n=1 Tax=Nocardia cyriacigeorgica TaxID=135487 RepID=UPI0024584E38|nr:ERF family protein [Nocardia cyriacigeorgica]